MKNLWNYISGKTKIALTMKQVVSYLTVIMACIHTVLFILFFCCQKNSINNNNSKKKKMVSLKKEEDYKETHVHGILSHPS